MSWGFIIVFACLLGVLTLISYVQRLYTEMGQFLSREFQENIEAFEQLVEPRLGVSRERAALSMAVLEQLCTAAIAAMVSYAFFFSGRWPAYEVLQAGAIITIIIVLFNRIVPYVLFPRTRGTWIRHFTLLLRVLIYVVMPITIVISFCQSVASLAAERAEPQPETPAEAVDALIEAGQEEGILEESDRDLIQSVVEFGDKTVREVMKPRPEIVAVSADSTIEQLTDLLRTRHYSRIPVYEGTIDHIVGIVHAHDLLQVADQEAPTRKVHSIMKPEVYFVPESKRVSDLLREMQRDNIRMEIVIDEYGAVAGLVTIEDMVEEIVGEIRDEHESKTDVVQEAEGTYVVPGNMDVDRLDELFGIRPEGHEATTIAGLVSEIAGRIPQRGEVITSDGLRFEVLDSTDRKVNRVRITHTQPSQPAQLRA